MSKKIFKPGSLRLLAGGVGALALAAAGLAATTGHGYAADKKEKQESRATRTSETSKTVIEADGDEKLKIGDIKNAGRIEVTRKDGERTVRIYDKKGKLLSDNTYGPDEELPINEVVVIGKDGTERTIVLASPADRKLGMLFLGKEGGGDGKEKRVIVISGDDARLVSSDTYAADIELLEGLEGGQGSYTIHFSDGQHEGYAVKTCSSDDGEGEPVMLEWKDEDGDETNKTVEYAIICLTGEDADPEHRAEALRKAIDRMEENAKKEEARRQKMIEKLRKQLQELEAEKK